MSGHDHSGLRFRPFLLRPDRLGRLPEREDHGIVAPAFQVDERERQLVVKVRPRGHLSTPVQPATPTHAHLANRGLKSKSTQRPEGAVNRDHRPGVQPNGVRPLFVVPPRPTIHHLSCLRVYQ